MKKIIIMRVTTFNLLCAIAYQETIFDGVDKQKQGVGKQICLLNFIKKNRICKCLLHMVPSFHVAFNFCLKSGQMKIFNGHIDG